jgi:hypothetical protein
VANKAGLRSIVRVEVGASEAKSSVPRLSSAVVLGAQVGDENLSSSSGVLGSLAGAADVGQLVADLLGDDGGVESFLLSFVDRGVLGLEGEFRVTAAVESWLEFHGWDAETEVETRRLWMRRNRRSYR